MGEVIDISHYFDKWVKCFEIIGRVTVEYNKRDLSTRIRLASPIVVLTLLETQQLLLAVTTTLKAQTDNLVQKE